MGMTIAEKILAAHSGRKTVSPGDLSFSGTPAGVGAARTPPVVIKPGDIVEVESARVCLLRNPVVASSL